MPTIPQFETQGTPQIGSRAAEIDPAAAGASAGALAQGFGGISNVAADFDRRYVEARRQADAADLVAGASKQLGDLQFKYSKVPDRAAAYSGFTADAAALRKSTLDGIADPLIKAHVQGRLDQEATIRGLDTQNAAFQLESSARRGDLDTRLNQYAQSAATANNDLLRAKITDDANADIGSSVAAGWLHPEEGVQHKLQFTSRIQQIAAEQERNAVLTSRDPDAARAFEKKINDPASFPGLLPQVREQLGYRAENLAYRIEAEDERRKREAEAIAIGRAKDLYTNEAAAIDARGVGVMPPGVVRHQLVAAYGPEQGKALSDDLDQRAMAYNDFQKVALTSPAEDQAVLGKYAQPSGAFNPQKSQEGQQILRAIAAKEQGLAKDPAGYVQSSSPQIAALFQAAKDPAKLSAAVAAQDAAFDRLGVSPENRTVLATPTAQDVVGKIVAAPPEQAAETIKGMSAAYGALWPRVYADLARAGLPHGYQALAALDDPTQSAILARGLAEQGKTGKQLVDLLPPKAKNGTSGIDVSIESSPAARDLLTSLSRSGASAGMQSDVLNAMKTLAYANTVYSGKEPAAAAEAAVAAFTDKYKFMPDGGARVPAERFDTIRAAAGDALMKLAPAPSFSLTAAAGLTKPGNLDPWDRPALRNPDGGYSTTSSISVGTPDGEVVIPTVVNGKRLPQAEAIARFKATGENFGTFSTPAQAEDFAQKLHEAQAATYDAEGNPLRTVSVPDVYGKPGMPKREDYLRLLQAAPTWITSPRADALWLMDHQGRIVRDRKGNPFAVPFDAAAPMTPPGSQFNSGAALP